MLTLPRRDRRHCLALGLLTLLLLVIPSVGPLSADSGTERTPFCREDGVCLPAPRLASELAADLRPEASQASEPAIPCEAPLLVKREAHVTPQAFGALLRSRGYAQIEGMLTPQWWRVCLSSPRPSTQSAELAALIALPEVAIAEPDGIATAAWTPNDPYYPDLGQWGLPKIGAPAAWDLTAGSSSVMIAVIDSGMNYYHPDSPLFLWQGCNMIYASTHPGACGDVLDDYGHGTHVTGIAAARTNNGVGVAGLCPGCSTLPVKVLSSSGTGYWSDVANGIWYAIDTVHGSEMRLIINLSLGAKDSYSSAVANAISAAMSDGAIVVAAAGNYGPAEPMFPASLPGVLAVSATDRNDRTDQYTYFSQYGDIGAPGDYIFSTWNDGTSASSPQPVCVGAGEYECYKYESGTSMASPFVAAAAGLVWSIHPEYTPLQVRFALYSSVDVPAGWDSRYGVGRLNVGQAVTGPPIVVHWIYLPLAMR